MQYALLCADSYRARCYLQVLCASKVILKHIVLMINIDSVDPAMQVRMKSGQRYNGEACGFPEIMFEPAVSIQETAAKYEIPIYLVESVASANSDKVIDIVGHLSADVHILGGWSGDILREEALTRFGRVLHVHSGLVPRYRGSTTMYYSLLETGQISASAFFLTKGIDEGDCIAFDSFDFDGSLALMDHVYDPLVRAKVLLDAKKNISETDLKNVAQATNCEEGKKSGPHFVIHPVLKRICYKRHEKIRTNDF